MPFQKGNPGGPGRPKVENSLSDMLRKQLKEPHPAGMTREQFIANKLLTIAETADDQTSMTAILKIMDRLEGTPKQSIEAEISDLRPIVFDNSLGKLVSKELPDDSQP